MTLIKEIKDKLQNYPSLSYSESENSITIHTPNKETGFDISLYIDTGEYTAYTVVFGNWHGQFDTGEEAGEFVALGLSSECRMREFSRGNSPYKWVVESLQNGKWEMVQETGLLFFPFWKKKSEKIYQNSIIWAQQLTRQINPDAIFAGAHIAPVICDVGHNCR